MTRGGTEVSVDDGLVARRSSAEGVGADEGPPRVGPVGPRGLPGRARRGLVGGRPGDLVGPGLPGRGNPPAPRRAGLLRAPCPRGLNPTTASVSSPYPGVTAVS